MRYVKLGSSDLMVSEVCLGTMTWGMQNTEEEGHAQLEYALARGVNFIDTAEMYPIPSEQPGHIPGRTEEILGSWLAKHPDRRSDLIIATKVLGYVQNSSIAANRTDPPSAQPFPDARLDPASIEAACNASLKRLNTDYIDLYQLHWPDRYTPGFGDRNYDPKKERESIPFRDSLLALKKLLDAGKIRAYGLSNETTFGVCQFVRLADEIGMPRPASIQNQFSLLMRSFEFELAEACAPRNFNIGLLPWSILGGGTLTGKYHVDGADTTAIPTSESADDDLKRSRFVKYSYFQVRYQTKPVFVQTSKYIKLAKKAGISPTTLAHAFCKSRWYIPSTIIGATSMQQLKENIDAFDVTLDREILTEIDEIHNEHKDPVLSVSNS